MEGARIKGRIGLDSMEVKGVERHRIIQQVFLTMAKRLSTRGNDEERKEEAKAPSAASIRQSNV